MLNLCSLPTHCLDYSDPAQHCWRPVVHGPIEDFTVQQHGFAHLVLIFFTVINFRFNSLPTSVVSTLVETSSPWKDRRFYCATSFCSLSAVVLHCDQHTVQLFTYQCRLLITITNSLDPDQARQNVGPELDPGCLPLSGYT